MISIVLAVAVGVIRVQIRTKTMSTAVKLRKIYYDLNHPASFSRPEVLARAAGVGIEKVKKWLRSQPTYTLHKNARKRFPTRKYVNNIDSQWQADLADMQEISQYNDGYKYMVINTS